MEGIHQIPDPSVDIGAHFDGELGQRLNGTMHLRSHERTCQQQLDDNQEGPSVLWTSVRPNFHGNVRQLDSERQTVQGMHWDVLRRNKALSVCSAGDPRWDCVEARCAASLSVGVPDIAQVRQNRSGQLKLPGVLYVARPSSTCTTTDGVSCGA